MTVAPDSEEGLPAKSAENDGRSGNSRKERRAAAKAAKAERKAARAAAKADKAAAKAARQQARLEAKAERKAARAQRREARQLRRAARKPVSKWVWLAPLLVLALAAFAAAAFLILVHVAPDFIDTLLYTPEELRIINY